MSFDRLIKPPNRAAYSCWVRPVVSGLYFLPNIIEEFLKIDYSLYPRTVDYVYMES